MQGPSQSRDGALIETHVGPLSFAQRVGELLNSLPGRRLSASWAHETPTTTHTLLHDNRNVNVSAGILSYPHSYIWHVANDYSISESNKNGKK